MKTSAKARDGLVRALHSELIGPFSEDEVLPTAPSRWYLSGFLCPQGDRESTADPSDEDGLGGGDDVDVVEAGVSDVPSKRKGYLPASMGMSFLVPPGDGGELVVEVSYADYRAVNTPTPDEKKKNKRSWLRLPVEKQSVRIPLDSKRLEKGIEIPDSGGLKISGILKKYEFTSASIPNGARAISLFVINERRASIIKGEQDSAFVFQIQMTVRCSEGFLPRPNLRDEGAYGEDAKTADLQFRDVDRYGAGHGVAVQVLKLEDKKIALQTVWIPKATVKRVKTRDVDGVEMEMGKLAALTSDEIDGALSDMVRLYGAWIEEQGKVNLNTDRATQRDTLMRNATEAKARIAEGIELLKSDPIALRSFCYANEVMHTQAMQRNPKFYKDKAPSWRLFQLAFLLLNLPSIHNPLHKDRDNVELIFFPTGGGKTEAYLGVIAFTLVLRRLRGQSRPDGGLGVAVLLRYTLRLLTLDQLGRAATLICALELLRKTDVASLGDTRFSIGLWVGSAATANTFANVARQLTEWRNSTSRNAPSPFPLTECPWCGDPFKKTGFRLLPNQKNPNKLIVNCANFRCEFSGQKNSDGLPVLFVDEQIYQELPSFIIATVDKFALMPWRGETSKFMGRVHSKKQEGDMTKFYGPFDSEHPKSGNDKLSGGLYPPELIVQDELHLIAGPLGTMVGLYEGAIEMLCTREDEDGNKILPKILASTATVRAASGHVKALFARQVTSIFPPPGIDDSESYFATEEVGDGIQKKEDIQRMYVGVAAYGRPLKTILLRVYTALMNAAQREYSGLEDDPADPYMTLTGYFNSLRELGGMRRLVEDQVRLRCANAETRIPENFVDDYWLQNREIQAEPVELTSRESTHKITESKARVEKPFLSKDHVDVMLASNMISVGVDIDRLGLMVIAGQPKTTSEYIQASSRVGRPLKRPGLVVTCYNLRKSRDRSHYEDFVAYHESFYREVEATSLTPFSAPALDRGLAGVIVAMSRLSSDILVPPSGVAHLHACRETGDEVVANLAKRAASTKDVDREEETRIKIEMRKRGQSLLDGWEEVIRKTKEDGGKRRYSKWEKGVQGKPLLSDPLDENRDRLSENEQRFSAAMSMRDVEPSVHIWVQKKGLGYIAGPGVVNQKELPIENEEGEKVSDVTKFPGEDISEYGFRPEYFDEKWHALMKKLSEYDGLSMEPGEPVMDNDRVVGRDLATLALGEKRLRLVDKNEDFDEVVELLNMLGERFLLVASGNASEDQKTYDKVVKSLERMK